MSIRRIMTALWLAVLITLLCGCGRKELTRRVVDCRYTEASERIETTYVYKYDFLGEGFRLMPKVSTVPVPEKYEVLYEITYDDGTVDQEWVEVEKAVFEEWRNCT